MSDPNCKSAPHEKYAAAYTLCYDACTSPGQCSAEVLDFYYDRVCTVVHSFLIPYLRNAGSTAPLPGSFTAHRNFMVRTFQHLDRYYLKHNFRPSLARIFDYFVEIARDHVMDSLNPVPTRKLVVERHIQVVLYGTSTECRSSILRVMQQDLND